MKISDNTSVSMPVKNMIGIVIAVAMGVFAYTDQEQFMLIESLFGDVEKLITNQEQNMTNKINIEFLKSQLEKALNDVEQLKDKVRQNGNGDH